MMSPELSKADVEIGNNGINVTHPSGVKVFHRKMDIELHIAREMHDIQRRQEQLDAFKKEYLDKVNAAPGPVAELVSPGAGR